MLKISPLHQDSLLQLERLLAKYQEYYLVKPDFKNNSEFLKQFLDHKQGIFFLGERDGENVGYVSLYFSYSSVSAKKIAILNDLYVVDEYRGKGFGKELIDHAINYAKNIGLNQVRWCTRIDNHKAQDLYSKYDKAKKTDWFHYDLTSSD